MLNKDYRKIYRRAFLVIVILFGAFIMLAYRSYSLQIVEGDIYRDKASRQTAGSVVIQPRRGIVSDRQNRLLAGNQQVKSLMAQPKFMDDSERELATEIVKSLFDLSKEELKRLQSKTKHFVWLKRRLSDSEAETFEKVMDSLPEETRPRHLGLKNEDKRFYPATYLAGPVLGFTDIDMNGLMGIELHFDSDLVGKSFRAKGLRDASGKVATDSLDLSLDVPTGDHVMLTLDKAVQYVTDKIIKETVIKHDANYGLAVLMEAHTGEILAMSQWPSLDPNNANKTKKSKRHNYNVEWSFEPGSTMKSFVIAAALESAKYIAKDTLYCEDGKYKIGPNIIHDHDAYDDLSVAEILIKSSNIGTAKIAKELGAELVFKSLEDFGFGQPSGIRLPAESSGILPPYQNWYPIELATISFGQGVNVTSLQLTSAMAVIANGGLLMKPQIVKSVTLADGQIKKTFEPKQIRRVLKKETAKQIQQMLTIAASKEGTAPKAQVDGCLVAGKTGTAQKLQKNRLTGTRSYWTSSFVGFFPAKNPKLVLSVIIDEPKGKPYYGGEVAAPAFKKIVEKVAPMLGVCTKTHNQLAELQ